MMNRVNRLIQLLLDQSSFQPASFFADQLRVSRQSIYQDMELVELKLKDYALTLERKQGAGYRISGSEEELSKLRLLLSEEDLSFDSPEYRRLALFAKILFSEKLATYSELADEYYVSTITIRKDFEKISEDLKKFGLEFDKKTNRISGKEIKLQECFADYLFTYLKNRALSDSQYREIFSDHLFDFVKKLVISLENVGNNANYFVNSLTISLLIFLKRLEQGKHIEESQTAIFSEHLDNLRFYQAAIDISDLMQSSLNLSMSDSDISYLGSLLAAHKFEASNSAVEINAQDIIEIEKVIQRMSELLDCDLSNDNDLKKSLISHMIPMVYRIKLGVRIKNPLKEEIVNQYLIMFQFVTTAMESFEAYKKISLTEDELSFLTVYFQIAFEKIDIAKHIIVVCSSGMGTSQLVYQRIKQILPRNDVVEIVDSSAIKDIDFEPFDLVVSTVKIPKLPVQTINVSALPTERELAKISEALYGIRVKSKKLSRSSPQDIQGLQDVLDEKYIYIHCPAEKMNDVIDFIAKELTEQGITREGFRESLYQRENLGVTSLPSGIALPHAEPTTVLQTKLIIITLDEAILWGEDKISVIILLVFTESDLIKGRNIIATLYPYLTSETFAGRMSAFTTKEEVIHELLQEKA